MKFLTDENISISVFKAVRNLNYDVKDVKEEKLYQTPDINLLKIASEEKRIIISWKDGKAAAKDGSNLDLPRK